MSQTATPSPVRTTGRVADLAGWAAAVRPGPDDEPLARRSLLDTVAVTLAAHDDPVAGYTRDLPEGLRWGAVGHVLDFDDVHLPSTAHVSVVCVAAALATGGRSREYLAGAGVFARLGAALGWEHYRRGWHATCTAGAPAAAVTAGLALGLDTEGLARAMALAVPGAGGVQRAFGTAGKSLQVGFAVESGIRAARLAAAGADADPAALDEWFALVGGSGEIDLSGPLVPDGLAIKLHPCCYALQRPIAVARRLRAELPPPAEPAAAPTAEVSAIRITVTEATLQPLIRELPGTGLEGKFSLPYAVAAALVDDFPGLGSFTDAAVARPEARRLMDVTEVEVLSGGDGILAGQTRIAVRTRSGGSFEHCLELPPGHPQRPASQAELTAKLGDCVRPEWGARLAAADWATAADLLRGAIPGRIAGAA